VGTTSLKVDLGNLMAHQTFIVVEHLSAPVILGCDFMTKQGLVMDFEQATFHSKESPDLEGRLQLQMTCMLALGGGISTSSASQGRGRRSSRP